MEYKEITAIRRFGKCGTGDLSLGKKTELKLFVAKPFSATSAYNRRNSRLWSFTVKSHPLKRQSLLNSSLTTALKPLTPLWESKCFGENDFLFKSHLKWKIASSNRGTTIWEREKRIAATWKKLIKRTELYVKPFSWWLQVFLYLIVLFRGTT